jgi:hypothetical protein
MRGAWCVVGVARCVVLRMLSIRWVGSGCTRTAVRPPVGTVRPGWRSPRQSEGRLRRSEVLEPVAENTSDAHHLDRYFRTLPSRMHAAPSRRDRVWWVIRRGPRGTDRSRAEISDTCPSFHLTSSISHLSSHYQRPPNAPWRPRAIPFLPS